MDTGTSASLAGTGLVLAGEIVRHVRDKPEVFQQATSLLELLWSFVARKPDVLITGMKSAGKTVLFDYLRDEGQRSGYRPPEISLRTEKQKLPAKGDNKAFRLVTIPGDRSPERTGALAKYTDSGVTGVIHVVANGFAFPRNDYARQHLLASAPTVEKAREMFRTAELEDLEETLGHLRRYWEKKRKRFWMVLVMSKTDLYSTEVEQLAAIEYYCRSGAPAKLLDNFETEIGRGNFQWSATFASTYPTPLAWGDTVVAPQIAREVADAYLTDLRAKIYGLVSREHG